jgi:NitT/TauT family transport system permease protein
VRGGVVPAYALSQPTLVFPRFASLLSELSMWRHIGITLVSLGMSAATLLKGVPLGRSAFDPVVLAFYTIPRLGLVPLFIVWFGFGMTPQVIVAAIHGFVIFYLGMSAALDSIPQELVASVRSMGGGHRDVLRSVSLPYAAPFLVASFRQALALGLGSVILAEMIGPLGGIGFLLSQRLARFDATGTIALILIAACVAVALDFLAAKVERRVTRSRE